MNLLVTMTVRVTLTKQRQCLVLWNDQ